MLGAKDNETRSYLEIADALRRYGAAPRDDLSALWRRIVFNILIANIDDHLRNHAFLYEGPDGWRLSPAYDLNPVPADIKPRILSTAITEDDGTGSVELALQVVEYFGLNEDDARAIIKQVRKAVATWQKVAAHLGLAAREIERMESAFLRD
jgi:serine/threonine-protein kinase HipA